ncbi:MULTISPECIES: helix-turn-helix domain-containing protein [unclassified Micromonospora]|uniref:helix-turn-helix domain-containing protein n=1 Tax=unclassified Micromonospora TaxID=2617518 RepID=UPI00363568F3
MNHGLIAAMAQAGETAESLAAQVGVDPKTAQRWVSLGRIPRPQRRSQLAAILGRDVEDLWPDVLKRREPAWFRPWVEIEREAVALRGFQLAWVPGLLQTEAYARATVEGEGLSPSEVDELAATRLARQAILRRHGGPLYVAVIDEGVLRRARPDARELMAAQVEHLVECAQLPSVQIHIVPASAGMYPGFGGPFTLAELSDGARVAYVDSQAQAQILEQGADLVTLERRWERIRGESLSRSQSLDLLREAAAAWT